MSRSTLCIQMLLLLKSRGFMTREELANQLHCNKRNIVEYKKELEDAGYRITSTSGKYGGYQLVSGALLPVVGFDDIELHALHEGTNYLKSHHDFLGYEAYARAMDKIQASVEFSVDESGVYIENEINDLTKRIQLMIEKCTYARKSHCVIELTYKAMNAKEYSKVLVQPYEILNYKGAYYCLGYSLKAKDFRNFKFSEERMKEVVVTTKLFQREKDFHVFDHVGKTGLMKDDVYELEIVLRDESALLISEKSIGLAMHKEWLDDHRLYVRTIMEGKMDVIKFILSLGNQCELRKPVTIRDEIVKIIEDMRTLYSYSS